MANNLFITVHEDDFDKAIEFLKKELSGLRTGRANTAIIESVSVEAYGAIQPLSQLASLSVPESSSIAIIPWDKSIMKDIEKALNYANLGLSLVNTGDKIIAKVPMLTEETRKEMVKVLGKKVEESRITVRKIRDIIKEEIIKAEKDNEITEDDKYQHLAELDNHTTEMNKTIDELKKEKEVEIMTV